MNLAKFSTILVMFSLFVACGKDDNNCVQADWVGTYTGTYICEEEESEIVKVFITASGNDKLEIAYGVDGLGLYARYVDPFEFNNCKVNFSSTSEEDGRTSSLEAEIDGDMLEMMQVRTPDDREDYRCKFVATRDQ